MMSNEPVFVPASASAEALTSPLPCLIQLRENQMIMTQEAHVRLIKRLIEVLSELYTYNIRPKAWCAAWGQPKEVAPRCTDSLINRLPHNQFQQFIREAVTASMKALQVQKSN